MPIFGCLKIFNPGASRPTARATSSASQPKGVTRRAFSTSWNAEAVLKCAEVELSLAAMRADGRWGGLLYSHYSPSDSL